MRFSGHQSLNAHSYQIYCCSCRCCFCWLFDCDVGKDKKPQFGCKNLLVRGKLVVKPQISLKSLCVCGGYVGPLVELNKNICPSKTEPYIYVQLVTNDLFGKTTPNKKD